MSKTEKIKIAIVGYGNLGRGAELAIAANSDMVLTNIFTRRDPKTVVPSTQGVRVLGAECLDKESQSGFEKPDVLLVCGGSAKDLPWQSPKYARKYNIVDSFDNHAKIYEHFIKVDEAARAGSKAAVIAAGWDPGLFSLIRAVSETVLPQGQTLTFWGKGISQGHSDALRRINGVLDARQYTVPKAGVLEAFRRGKHIDGFLSENRHERICFVVTDKGVDKGKIKEEIIHMPDYFEGYKTEVNFVSLEELRKNHSKMPHGGTVIRTGYTGAAKRATLEFSLKLESNPEFTAEVMVAYARAVYRMAKSGETGCRTVFDIPPNAFCPLCCEEMINSYL